MQLLSIEQKYVSVHSCVVPAGPGRRVDARSEDRRVGDPPLGEIVGEPGFEVLVVVGGPVALVGVG